MPERRRLHASRRSRPRAHRGDGIARGSGNGFARACWPPRCPTPSASAWRCGSPASPGRSLGCCAASASTSSSPCSSWRPRGCCAAAISRVPARRDQGRAPAARDPARRLRPAGAAARDQRRHHPPAGAPRRRRRGGAGRRLLRGARASHGQRGRPASPWPSATSTPGRKVIEQGRSRRRHRHQRLGLRHHGQGLRPYAGARAQVRRAGRQESPRMARDVTEFLGSYDMGPPKRWSSLRVAYHSACSHAARPAHHTMSRASCCATPASP